MEWPMSLAIAADGRLWGRGLRYFLLSTLANAGRCGRVGRACRCGVGDVVGSGVETHFRRAAVGDLARTRSQGAARGLRVRTNAALDAALCRAPCAQAALSGRAPRRRRSGDERSRHLRLAAPVRRVALASLPFPLTGIRDNRRHPPRSNAADCSRACSRARVDSQRVDRVVTCGRDEINAIACAARPRRSTRSLQPFRACCDLSHVHFAPT